MRHVKPIKEDDSEHFVPRSTAGGRMSYERMSKGADETSAS